MEISLTESHFERALISAISKGLPLVKRPYAAIANEIGSSETEVIDGIQKLIDRGDIKRFGIIVHHRSLGYRDNAMVVWDIDDDSVTALAQQISRFEFVNLCYQRPRRLPKWPYNLFCMIHGKNRTAVIEQVEMIIRECHLFNYRHDILFSRRCFKQRGASYQIKSDSETRRFIRSTHYG